MLIYFTDAMSKKSIAINPEHVIAVLESPNNEEVPGNTVVNLITGTVALEEKLLNVVGMINGELHR
jgi:hypothetical protein